MTKRLAILLWVGIALTGVAHSWRSQLAEHLSLTVLAARASYGDSKAQPDLGVAYANRGDSQRPFLAVMQFRKAAEQAKPNGQFRLGAAPSLGFVATENQKLAHMWSYPAEQCGSDALHRDISQLLPLASNKLTPERLADTQRMGREWQEPLGTHKIETPSIRTNIR